MLGMSTLSSYKCRQYFPFPGSVIAWTDIPFAVEGLAFLLCVRCSDTLEKSFENFCVCGLAHIHEGALISGSQRRMSFSITHESLSLNLKLIISPRLGGWIGPPSCLSVPHRPSTVVSGVIGTCSPACPAWDQNPRLQCTLQYTESLLQLPEIFVLLEEIEPQKKEHIHTLSYSTVRICCCLFFFFLCLYFYFCICICVYVSVRLMGLDS